MGRCRERRSSPSAQIHETGFWRGDVRYFRQLAELYCTYIDCGYIRQTRATRVGNDDGRNGLGLRDPNRKGAAEAVSIVKGQRGVEVRVGTDPTTPMLL